MQQANLKFMEIIWEITGKCNNGCSYCGSKDLWKETVDEEIILSIADRISVYPPAAIDISGGDPLLVSYNTHKYITELLKGVGTQVKILVNPKSLKVYSSEVSSKVDILKLYNWIGLSVNTEDELKMATHFSKDFPTLGITIITNFNTGNLYMFDYLKKFVKSKSYAWQIQLTMTDDESAIYKNDLSLDSLFSKIQEAIDENVNVIPADNLNAGQCGAGTSILGLLCNGDVVPCLSMRSWKKDISSVVEGNIIETSLRTIWEDGFREQRFSDFYCCKDECGNKCFKAKPKLNINDIFKQSPTSREYPYKHSQRMLYGVSPNDYSDRVMTYAVSPGLPHMVYGVHFNTSGTSISNTIDDQEK